MKLGIDLGGSKIEGVLLSREGLLLGRERIITPGNDYEKIINSISDLISRLCQLHSIESNVPVGVGIPGSLSPKTGLVKNANTTCLIGKAFDKDLSSRLSRPVKLNNDANCFTMSEAIDGAGQDFNVVFGVILGTGVGGGISIQKEILVGPNAITGEWGHNPFPWLSTDKPLKNQNPAYNRQCYCGKNNCIETFLSGPGLMHEFFREYNYKMTPEEMVKGVTKGIIDAKNIINRYELRLAKALAGVINILDPDVIVLGGGLSNIPSLYNNVPKLWQEWVFSDHCNTKLKKNIHGDSSGVRGAAWLWG